MIASLQVKDSLEALREELHRARARRADRGAQRRGRCPRRRSSGAWSRSTPSSTTSRRIRRAKTKPVFEELVRASRRAGHERAHGRAGRKLRGDARPRAAARRGRAGPPKRASRSSARSKRRPRGINDRMLAQMRVGENAADLRGVAARRLDRRAGGPLRRLPLGASCASARGGAHRAPRALRHGHGAAQPRAAHGPLARRSRARSAASVDSRCSCSTSTASRK